MSKTNDTEQLFRIVETIPEGKQRGKLNEAYVKFFEAIIYSDEGTKAQLSIDKTQCGNIRSALITKRNKSEKKANFKPFLLYTRNPIRKKVESEKGKTKGKMVMRLVSGELYFERISVEEWNKRKEEKKSK